MFTKINKFLGYLLLLTVFSCASTPPSQTLPHAEVAVTSIDHANFQKYTNEDIAAAKTKLQQAQHAAEIKEHSQAEQLAQQILVDVELIKIKTQRLSLEQDVKDLEDEIANLHQEIQWREPVQLSPLNQ